MRKTVILLSLLAAWSAFGQASPDSLLERGTTAYRSGDYSSAVTDLQAAAQGFLSPEKMQTYVNSGTFDQLDKFETALVYLALAQSKLGRDAGARETILRMMSAERISPTYKRLQISESGDFDALVTALVPSATLSRDDTTALPTVRSAEAAAQQASPASLRQAEALVNAGDLEGANAIYAGIAGSGHVPREVLAEAAVGLYRTGAFRQAASAFQKLGTFAKGEEDLRYYNAVALFEIGAYEDARKELACALPFIQVTDDVSRYRAKIEGMALQYASME